MAADADSTLLAAIGMWCESVGGAAGLHDPAWELPLACGCWLISKEQSTALGPAAGPGGHRCGDQAGRRFTSHRQGHAQAGVAGLCSPQALELLVRQAPA